jgi:hypothetical protein
LCDFWIDQLLFSIFAAFPRLSSPAITNLHLDPGIQRRYRDASLAGIAGGRIKLSLQFPRGVIRRSNDAGQAIGQMAGFINGDSFVRLRMVVSTFLSSAILSRLLRSSSVLPG